MTFSPDLYLDCKSTKHQDCPRPVFQGESSLTGLLG